MTKRFLSTDNYNTIQIIKKPNIFTFVYVFRCLTSVKQNQAESKQNLDSKSKCETPTKYVPLESYNYLSLSENLHFSRQKLVFDDNDE